MEIINDKYRIENIKLGAGGFSEVFLGTNIETNQNVAIKKVSLLQKSFKDEKVRAKLTMEIELMKKLNHPNIVNYYDLSTSNTDWYIIMEYCNAGTLDHVIKYNEMMSKKKEINFNREENTYYYMNQLKNALNYFRELGYMHRDIKPMNVLLIKNNKEEEINYQNNTIDFESSNNYNHSEKLIVKLADFGLARNYDNEESLMNTICGSPLYMAPELIFNKEYNSQADLWSYGIIMYQMLFGVHPNNAFNFDELIKNLRSKDIDFHLTKNFNPYCFDLLKKLLVKNPQ